MFVHGLADETVPPSQSKRAVEAAADHGVDVECEFVAGASHGLSATEGRVTAFDRSVSFLAERLGS